MAEILEQLRLIIEQVIVGLGYPGIAAVMFVENLFPPIPSELVMPFAGFLVAQERLSLAGILIAGTLGSMLGAMVLYYLGCWLDEPVIRALVRRYGRFLLLEERDLDRAMAFFARYGQIVVFFGRLVPVVRSLISIPAGMNRMSLGAFLVSTTLGTVLWNGLLAVIGLVLGENWQTVLDLVRQYEKMTLLVLGGLALAFLYLRLRGMRVATRLPEKE